MCACDGFKKMLQDKLFKRIYVGDESPVIGAVTGHDYGTLTNRAEVRVLYPDLTMPVWRKSA